MPIESVANTATETYLYHVNPQWVKLLDLLEMNVSYERCQGAELFAADGRVFIDFLSGYCVHNTGHNHPKVVAALQEELAKSGPAMLQSHVPELAGELGARLCRLAGGGLEKTFFCSSGSEGVEAAIKFSRAHTRRSGLLYAEGGFHGLTCGALSLMDNKFWREGFGPLLPQTESVPFDDLEALREKLGCGKYAAYIVEPIQSEAGIRVPSLEYWLEAEALCRKHGTLLVFDEVQTGLHRTGPFLAAHSYGVKPDMVILAKALSGGLIPVGAVLMRNEIYESVFTSLKKAIVHTSTFGENSLAMRAGLATLDVLENEDLGRQAEEKGTWLRDQLRHALAPYEMVDEVLGAGMLSGIRFKKPSKLSLRLGFEAFQRIHPGMFGQMLVMRMFRQENILTQICGNNFMVLKVAPPLGVTDEQMERFIQSIERIVREVHSSGAFWTEALGFVSRVVNV
ncbi:MAG: aminotransferase [Acidobacteriales bacterium]|nr:aminotransferase [Terriglobales bacterium]